MKYDITKVSDMWDWLDIMSSAEYRNGKWVVEYLEDASPPPSDYVEIDIFEYHRNEGGVFYPEPNVDYRFTASGTLTDTLKVNLYGAGSGNFVFDGINIRIDNDRKAFSFNDMATNRGQDDRFTGSITLKHMSVSGSKLQDAFHISTADADVILLDCSVDGCGSAGLSSHPDVVQMVRGFNSLTIKRLIAIDTRYQGIFLGNDFVKGTKNTPVGDIVFEDVHISGESNEPLFMFYHTTENGTIKLKDVVAENYGSGGDYMLKVFDKDGRSRNVSFGDRRLEDYPEITGIVL